MPTVKGKLAQDLAKKAGVKIGSTKRHKYGAERTTVGGITFDSKKEAKRYGELRLLEKAGEIDTLVLQPKFHLRVKKVLIGYYVADFSYWKKEHVSAGPESHRVRVIEDVKGVRTPLYLWKKKHVEAEFGITITEI